MHGLYSDDYIFVFYIYNIYNIHMTESAHTTIALDHHKADWAVTRKNGDLYVYMYIYNIYLFVSKC